MNQFQVVQDAVLHLLCTRNDAARKAKFRNPDNLSKTGVKALSKKAVSRDWYRGFPNLKYDYPADMDPLRGQWSTLGVMEKHDRLFTAWFRRIKITDEGGAIIPGKSTPRELR
jgi:hypothetical protein